MAMKLFKVCRSRPEAYKVAKAQKQILTDIEKHRIYKGKPKKFIVKVIKGKPSYLHPKGSYEVWTNG